MTSFAFVITRPINLTCKLVPVQYLEYKNVRFVIRKKDQRPREFILYIVDRMIVQIPFTSSFLCQPKVKGNFRFLVPLCSACNWRHMEISLFPFKCFVYSRSIETSMYLYV